MINFYFTEGEIQRQKLLADVNDIHGGVEQLISGLVSVPSDVSVIRQQMGNYRLYVHPLTHST